MLDLTHFWSNFLLGLDIQDDEIRLLQLQRIKKKHSIKQALAMSLPVGAVIDGKIKDAELVTDCLQQLVQRNNLQKSKVAIALPENCVVSKRIAVAKGQRGAELESEVISHLSHCFPNSKEGLCYDYTVIKTHDEMQNDVLLVAALFTHLNTHVTIVQNSELEIDVVDVDCYALARANQVIEKENLNIEKKWLISFGLALRRSEQ